MMLHYQFTIHSLLYLVTVLISLAAAFVAFGYRKATSGLILAILLLLSAWWSAAGIFESASTDPEMKFLWSGIEYLGGVNVPVLLLLLTIQYTHPGIRFKPVLVISLFIIPAVTVIAALTNDFHHLVWTGYMPGPEGSNQIIYQHGAWFWIGFMGYSYLMMLASMLLLVNSLIQQRQTFRYQIIAFLIALALPWIGNILYLFNLNPLPGLDLTRIAFSGSGIILVYSISTFRFLDLLPRARTLLIDSMSDGMLVIDPMKRILDINQAALFMLGLGKKENVIGKTIEEFDSDSFRQLSLAVGSASADKVYFIRSKYIEVNITPLVNKKGDAYGSSIYMHDITDLKKKEKEIELSEEKYRALAENISDVIWMIDSNMRYIYVSPSIEKQRGYTVEEFMKLRPEDVYSPESYAVLLRTFGEYIKLSKQGLVSRGTSMSLEVEHRCKDGTIKTGEVHANAVLDENNVLVAVHGITRDITERKLEESALKQRDKLLHSITRAVISLLQRADLEVAIEEALQILGEAINADRVYIFENLKGQKPSDTGLRLRHQWTGEGPVRLRQDGDIPYTSYQDSLSRWYERFASGKSVSGFVRDFPDLERMILEPLSVQSLLAIPIFIDNNFWGFIGFDDCRTERVWSQTEENVLTTAAVIIGTAYIKKRTELELIKAKEQAEESDRLKSAFLATMSHELRTPLNAIIGFSGIISQEMDPSEQEEYIKIINRSGKNLLNIIEDLFNISMIESGDFRIEMEHFSFEKFRNKLNEILYTEMKSIDRPNLAIHYSPDPSWPDLFLFTDQAKLLSIFSNILKNAVKFTMNGSIEYGYVVGNGKEVTFFIRDTGIGIAPEMQHVIFEKFRQVDESYTRKFGGTGLGLSISKRLAEVLNGTIWVESEPGKGSDFRFLIPCRDLSWHSNKIKSGETTLLSFLHNRTILLTEDEESNYLLIKTMLKHSEAKLIWAKNGKEAVEMIDVNQEISLVLMDIKMPVMDGYEATKISKTLRPKLPVIALTAHALYGDEEKAFRSGFDNYIPKPINKNQLFTVLEQYLS